MLRAFFITGALLLGSFAYAQAPTTAKKVIDGGVSPIQLLDRPEVRITRTEINPGIKRAVHQHDDVKFHLFLPLTSGIELTIGSEKPVMTDAGQAYFIPKSTPHTFRNTGSTLAMTYEVFIRDTPAAAAMDPKHIDLAQVLAMVAGAK